MRALALTLIAIFATAVVGCGQEQPTTSGPKISDLAAEQARVKAKIKKNRELESRRAAIAQEAEKVATPAESVLDTSMGAVEAEYVYNYRGRRDPFRSSFWEQRATSREVRGPLEQYELGQLAVTAIVWETNRPRALVTDPGGTSYVIREGSRVGKNDGLVIHIADNLVLVKETYVDFAGEQSTKDVEMRIRRTEGG